MSWPTMQMVMNQPVSNIEEFYVFKDLVKVSCADMKISDDDDFCELLESTNKEMELLFTELHTVLDPKKRKQINNQIISCRNQLCTKLHKRYIELHNQTNTIDNQ